MSLTFSCYSVVGCEFDPDGRGMRLVNLCKWQFFLVLRVLKFEVELLGKVCNQDLEVAFSKCFAKADTLPSMERSPARGFSLLA